MREIRVEKIVLNIGTGEGGEKLDKAEKVLGVIAERRPKRTYVKKSIRDWGIKEGEPIGCMVTLRRESAIKVLKSLLDAVEEKIKADSFDDGGNLSFGIKEHIDIPGMSYDPDIGIFGMDVSVVLERRGYRIKRRSRRPKSVPRSHKITTGEAINFMSEKFKIEVL